MGMNYKGSKAWRQHIYRRDSLTDHEMIILTRICLGVFPFMISAWRHM